jgi:hypothetical protein
MYGVHNARVNLAPPAWAIFSVLLGLVAPCHGEAQEWVEATDPSIGIALGTSGLGVDAGVRPWERVGARLALGWIPFEPDIDEDDVTGSASFPSPITRLTLDWFPRSGDFHLSAGLHRYSGGISARAVARDTVELNDRDYGPEELGEVTGRVWGRENAPYLGLGWQRRTARVQPTLDLGVAFTGTPRITVNVSGPARNDPTFQADLASEIREAEEDISSYRFFPHLALGLRVRIGG